MTESHDILQSTNTHQRRTHIVSPTHAPVDTLYDN